VKKIYLIRHGATAQNGEGRYIGCGVDLVPAAAEVDFGTWDGLTFAEIVFLATVLLVA